MNNNKKATKRALLTSIMALVMCVVMLVGTTFAWFTDTASTGVNKIQAGNLAIDLIHVKNNENISIKEHPDHLIFDYDKWEPGYTAVETLRVENKGNLALKFRLDALADGATAGPAGEKLADVIDVYVSMNEDASTTSFADMTEANGWRNAGPLSSLLTDRDGMAYGVLLPTGATPEPGKNEPIGSVQMTVALHMQESAGNAYQGLSLGDLRFTLNATQYTYESDSFGTDYDKKAHYDGEISTAAELAAFIDTVLANKGEFHQDNIGGELVENSRYYNATVKLACDIDMTGVEWSKDLKVNDYSNIVIDGNSHSIKNLTTTGGLFGEVGIGFRSTLTIKNLTIDKATVTGKDYPIGSAAGAFEAKGGAVKYINCKVINSTIKDAKYAGGFVGYDSTGGSLGLSTENCTVENTIVTATNSGSASAGGFCGYTASPHYHVGLDVKDDVNVTVNEGTPYAGRYYGTVNKVVTLKDCHQQAMGDTKLAGRVVSGSIERK